MTDKNWQKTYLYIKKFWSLIMDNEQLFDLTSPPSAEFYTAQECFDTKIIMQNRTAMQWCSYYSKKLSRQILRWLLDGWRENVRNPIILQVIWRPMGPSNNSWFKISIGWKCTYWVSLWSLCCERNKPKLQDLSWMLWNYGNPKAVLKEPAMEGTSNADPVSLNNSCSRKRITLICGTCGGNHYRKTHCWNRNLWSPFKNFRHVFSNFRRVFSKTLFLDF